MSKIKVNEDENFVEEVRRKIKENGGYCCCSLYKNEETRCMCKEFRDQIERGEAGPCTCGQYIFEP